MKKKRSLDIDVWLAVPLVWRIFKMKQAALSGLKHSCEGSPAACTWERGDDHEGWNIVLVRPESDLYSEWRLVETRMSALSRVATKYEPIATNAQLFATNLGYHWMNTMHRFNLKDKPLEKADIVRIVGVFIPK